MYADDELHHDKRTEYTAPLLVYPYLAYGFQLEIHKRKKGRQVPLEA